MNVYGFPGFPWAVEGFTNAAATSFFKLSQRFRRIHYLLVYGRAIMNFIFYFQGWSEYGSNNIFFCFDFGNSASVPGELSFKGHCVLIITSCD